MRYLVGFMFVLALVAAPLSVSAQDAEEGTTSEPNLQERAPPSEPVPEEPALQLKLDDAGVQVTSPPARVAWAEHAVERHRRGLIISSVLLGVGVGAVAGSLAWAPHAECGDDDPATLDICIPAGPIVVGMFGAIMATGGLIGAAVKGARLAKSKSELRELKEAQYGTPRRARWDLAQSRLVF
jgi:hypothetical protein